MKTEIFINLFICFVVVFSAQFVSANNVEIYLEKDLSAMKANNNKFFSYKSLSAEMLTDRQIILIAEKLLAYTNSRTKFEEAQIYNENGRVYLKSQDDNSSTAYFDIDPILQGFIYRKEMDEYLAEEETKGLPDKSYAPKLAEEHLKALDLLPENYNEEMELLHVGGVGMAMINESGSSKDYEKLATVVFGRTLDGLPVKGASRIVVKMGIEGELVGLVKNWPKLNKKPIPLSNLIASENRAEHLKRHLLAFYSNSNVDAVTVDKASIVMYDDGHGTIEPAMFVLGEITQRDGYEYKADWIVPLLKLPHGKYSILEKTPRVPSGDHGKIQFEDVNTSMGPDGDDLIK